MANLINKIKSIIPLKTKIILSYLKNINHNAYDLNYFLKPNTSSSDFFIWDKDCLSIGFIAENIRAILLGYEVPVIHHFKFFTKEGELLEKQSFKSNDFFAKINFKKINSNDKYISFIHYVESSLNLKEILISKGVNKISDFAEQNRGYTVYYPYDLITGVVVHGNFGGISKDLKKSARQTFIKHIYTPIYKFEESSDYDLVFNNPTPNLIRIKVTLNELNKSNYLTIPSMGTRYLNIKNFSGSVSFISKLSICRSLIFKNPTKNLLGNFDVFHS